MKTAALAKDGLPKEDSAGERDQSEDSAKEIVPTVYEGILQSEIEYGEILFHVTLLLSKPSVEARSCKAR